MGGDQFGLKRQEIPAFAGMTERECRLRGTAVVWREMTVAWSRHVSGGFVYIMTNRPRGTLYIGVTADLVQRIAAHKAGRGSQFVWRYNLFRLAYFESYDAVASAIAREKRLKHWNRAWKLRLIEEQNPDWVDLMQRVNA